MGIRGISNKPLEIFYLFFYQGNKYGGCDDIHDKCAENIYTLCNTMNIKQYHFLDLLHSRFLYDGKLLCKNLF